MTDDDATDESSATSERVETGASGTASEVDESVDPLEAAGVDPVVPADAPTGEFPNDEAVREFLRAIAEDVRGDDTESAQLAAILYRVSDLYDPAESTSPTEIYLNVRHIMRITEQGGLER